MVRAAIACLALPSLLHAFVPFVPQRPVLLRGPLAPGPAAALSPATQRPAAPGAYLQPLRPFPASPLSGWRVSQDATMRLPVPLTAPAAITPALFVYRYLMMGGMCMIAAFVIRRILKRPSAVRLRAWASTVGEMVKKLVYTIFATVATSVMTMTLLWSVASGPAVALTTREAPVQQTRVHRRVDTGKEMQRRLDERLGSARVDEEEEKRVQVKKQPQQKMIKYSAKNYIFSDSLTSIPPLEREFDDILWQSLGNRQAVQRKILTNVGGGLILVGVGKAGLESFDRLQKRQDRKDIEEELKNTGRYVSVDASNVTEFTNAVTGKTRKLKKTNMKNQPIKGSLVIHYEIPKANGGLARDIRKKVEDKKFATKYIDTLQATFRGVEGKNRTKKSEAGKEDELTSMKILEGLEGDLSMEIPTVQAPTKQGGVIKGRVYFTEFKKKAMDTIMGGYGNAGSRETIKEAFGGALSEVFGIEDRAKGKVIIMNIVQNRDPEFGEGGRMKNRAVRQLLSNAAPWFLRWIESTDAAGDDGFWETDVMQSVYEDKKISQKKEDDKKDTEF
jgi:hypothetical protein